MSTKKIATSTLWQIASQVAMAVLAIVTVKFVAIGLSKELAGMYNTAYSSLQFFGILADFGLFAVAIREMARSDKPEEVLSALFILRFLVTLLSLGSALLLVWVIPTRTGTPLPLAVSIASLVPFFTLLAGMIRTVFQIHYKMHFVFIAEVAQRVVTVTLIGAFVLLLGLRNTTDIQYLYLFLGFGGAGAFLLFAISLGLSRTLEHISLQWNWPVMKDLLQKAAPFGVAYLCIAAYRYFDITLIALLRPDYELQNAYYGFVVRMVDMGFLIPTFLLNSTLPILSDRDEKGEQTDVLLGKTLLLLLLIGSIGALFAFFWARPLVLLLTAPKYVSTALSPGSDTALRLLALPIFLNGLMLYGFYVLLNRHVWKKLVLVLVSAVVVSITLNVQLIPLLGFQGAGITSIVVHTLLVLGLLPAALRIMKATIPATQFVQWILISGVFGFVLWGTEHLLIDEFMTVIGLGLSLFVLGLLVWITGMQRYFVP